MTFAARDAALVRAASNPDSVSFTAPHRLARTMMAVAAQDDAGGNNRAVAALFTALSLTCTLVAHPLYPFKLHNMAWLTGWFWMTMCGHIT